MAQAPDVDDDERDPESELRAPNRPGRPGAPLFKRWVIACLVVAVVAGSGALVWRFHVQDGWGRSAPKLDVRYEAAALKLALPQTVSPSEEYLGPDGEIVFVTQDELRAVSQASVLSATTARKLAAALAEREPTRRIERLFALVSELPTTPASDKQAIMLYRFASSALSASTAPTRADTKAKLDHMIGCRFVGPNLPKCPDRPSDVPMWALLAFAIAALTAGSFGLVSALSTRRRARREEQAVDAADVMVDEAKEGA